MKRSAALRWFVTAWAVVMLLFVPPQATAQDRVLKGVALVVGQSGYLSLTPLPNPANDARAMAALLSDLGFEVDMVTDTDGASLSSALASFAEDADGADVALVYYSGHGIEAGGRNYLVPTDATPSDPEGLASASDLLENLQRTVPVVIVLLDACRDNPFPPGAILTDENGAPQAIASVGLGATRGVKALVSDPAKAESVGAIVGFAAEPGKVALDGEAGGNSPYAAALVKHLAASGLHFGDVMTLVGEEVYLRSDGRQTPWTNASLRRQLYFGGTAEAGDDATARIRDERRGLLLTIATLDAAERAQVNAVARELDVPMDVLFAALRAAGDAAPRAPDALDHMLHDKGVLAKQRLAGSPVPIADPELARLSALADEAVREGALVAATEFHRQARERMDALATGLDAVEAATDDLRRQRAAVYAASAATGLLNFEHAKAAEDFRLAFAEVDRVDDDLAIGYKLAQANALFDQGYYRADNAALEAATEAFRDAADIAPLRRHPDQWLLAQAGLGKVLATLGDREASNDRLEESVDVMRKAFADMPPDTSPDLVADLKSDFAYALFLSGMREAGVDRLDQAAVTLGEALMIVPIDTRPREWARLMHRMAAAQYELGRRLGEPNTLEAALGAAESALQIRTRDSAPLDWMTTENNRALILSELGTLGLLDERLGQAIEAYRGVLEVATRERSPLLWAETVSNLGSTQSALAERSGSRKDLDDALASFRLAATEMTRERAPLRWAALQDNIGMALRRQGERDKDAELLSQAIEAFSLSREERRRDLVPAEWAATGAHLANAYWTLSQISKTPVDLDRAIAAAQEASEEIPRDTLPIDWAMLRNNLAGMLFDLGTMRDDPVLFTRAAEEYRQALSVFNPEQTAFLWAQATGSLGEALLEAGKRGKDVAILQDAKATLDQAVEIWTVFGDKKRKTSAQLLAGEAQLALLSLDVADRLKDAGSAN